MVWREQGFEPLCRLGLVQVSWQEEAGGSSVRSYLEEQCQQYPGGVSVESGWIGGTLPLRLAAGTGIDSWHQWWTYQAKESC